MKTIILSCSFLFCISLNAATFYVDPVNGNMNNDGSINAPWTTIQDLLDDGLIESVMPAAVPYTLGDPVVPRNPGAPVQPGDTIYCLSGYQGDLAISNYYNTDYIYIIGLPGHQVEFNSIDMQSSSRWSFDNLIISKEFSGNYGGVLFYIDPHPWRGPVSDIELKNSTLYTIWDAYSWSAADWGNNSSHGIYNSYAIQNIHLYNNYIRNTSMAIQMVGSDAFIEGNTIENFSGDGIRVNGDRLHVYYNTVMNGYDIQDGNHDDLIQSFNLGTGTYDDCHIVGNLLIGSNDPNQPSALLSDPQGIGMFDGFYENWVISNNVIVVNHWHGITLMGARNCTVTNNTLTKKDIAHPNSPWIRIVAHKNGTPSVNNTITNNTYYHSVTNQDGPTSNNVQLNTAALYDQHFVDWQNNDFHLIPASTLIDAGTTTGAPTYDRDSVSRPLGGAIDVGAYEYGSPIDEECDLTVASNVNDANCNAQDGEIFLTVTGGLPGYTYQWNNGLNTRNITGLSVGTYTVSITDENECMITLSYEVELNCCPTTANPCLEAFQGIVNICSTIGNNPNLPLGTYDCDGDGVSNADECTDGTDPIDLCDFIDTSISMPVIADQTGCPQPCSNLTPTATVLPSTIAGTSAVEVAIVISEVDGVDTDGTNITLRVPSDPRLMFIWDVGLTQVAGIPVQNTDWNYLGSNGVFSSWIYNGNGQIINANSSVALGFQAIYDPQNTDGQTTITATVVPFSGGDCNSLNNTDSEILIYFK